MAKVPLVIGGEPIPTDTVRRLDIPVAMLPTHTMLHLPVTVVRGRRDGARLWISAALHGDELNGMEIIRRVLDRVRPAALRGTLIAVPIVNVFGFINQSRYLPDRRDLNRSFPGSRSGSLAARLARLFLSEIVAHCTHGIDLHTAAPPRTNLPQIRANLQDAETRRCAEAFRAPVMIHGPGPKGSLRSVTAKRGVPVLLYEAGEPMRFTDDAIDHGVDGVLRVMAALRMVPRRAVRSARRSIEATSSKWLRAPQSGVLYLAVGLGERVRRGEQIGKIGDPFGEATRPVEAPVNGMVIGCTNNPLVHRGDAVVHLATFGR